MIIKNDNYPEPLDTSSNLIILKGNDRYVLPVGWSLTDFITYENNLKLQDRAYSHGSYAVGDGKMKGRTVQVEFDMVGISEEVHDAMVNLAYRYFNNQDYKLLIGREDREYRVSGISKFKSKYQKGYKQRWSNITVTLLLADPFRYATSQTVISKSYKVAQTKTEITIENPSSIDVPLIWEFAPPSKGTASNILIYHKETGESFTLKDTMLTNPAVAVVNAETGIVRRDKGNSLNTFSGLFLHANPGSNTYEYTGAACDIKISFTARWFT